MTSCKSVCLGSLFAQDFSFSTHSPASLEVKDLCKGSHMERRENKLDNGDIVFSVTSPGVHHEMYHVVSDTGGHNFFSFGPLVSLSLLGWLESM